MFMDEVVTKTYLKQELTVFKSELKVELSHEFAIFFGQMTRYIDKRLEIFQKQTQVSFDKISIQIDSIIKRVDDDEIERAAQSSQLNRHQGWICQLADSTQTKLIPKH